MVGSTPEDPGFDTYLCSKKQYKDFELSFKVRLAGGVGNSGVQIRSKLIDKKKFVVHGPQCDIGKDYWGCLYGEGFGGMMKAAPKGVIEKVVKQREFNDYAIKCVGKHVTIKVNGETAIDDDFPTLPDEGIIAWQLHRGYKSMEVTFEEIKFKELPSEKVEANDKGFVSLFNGKDLEGWTVDSGDEKAWQVIDGELVARGAEENNFSALVNQGYLLSDRKYTSFVLRCQFRMISQKDSWGGIALRAVPHETTRSNNPNAKTDSPAHLTVLIGSCDSCEENEDLTGSLWWAGAPAWRLQPDKVAVLKKVGEWNDMEIEMRGQSLRIAVNGSDVQNVMLNKSKPEVNPMRGLSRVSGKIGFKKRFGEIRYRKVEIKELSPRAPD